MIGDTSDEVRPAPQSPHARRSIGGALFVIIMVLACVVALLATTFYLTGTFVSGVLPTVAP